MNWKSLRDGLMALHSDKPALCRIIETSLHEAEIALGRLAAMGHPYHLAEGLPTDDQEYPKVVWNADGRSHTIAHPFDINFLGEGPWCDTLVEAKRQAGVRTQFAGRGGVRTTNLPALLSLIPGGKT